MRPASLALLLFAVLAASPARAQGTAPPEPAPRVLHPPPRAPISARLDYRLGPGGADCPGVDYLRQEIARRMGYDPFAPEAKGSPIGSVRVEIARSPKGLTGTYTLTSAEGVDLWTRTYSEPSTVWLACRGVNQGIAVELTGEFQVREMRLARRGPHPASEPPVAPPEPAAEGPRIARAAPQEPAPSPVPRPTRGPRAEVGATIFAGGGTAPRATLGGALRVGLVIAPFGDDHARLSFAAEGRADAPAMDERGIRTQLFAGSFVTCGHWDLVHRPGVIGGVLLCALGTAGAARSSWRDEGGPQTRGAAYVGAGVRAGVEARLSPVVALRAQGEALPTIVGARFLARGASSGSGSVAGNAGLAVVLAF